MEGAPRFDRSQVQRFTGAEPAEPSGNDGAAAAAPNDTGSGDDSP
jgi:hypothetical protein